ncbi:hypothetical protein LQ567_25430 [Niabella pedocola]|uniref:DUF5723 domain-containing protein n=1 Tax=Niabella pedocola TaxID=1752077 RepID=A0ABS8Q0T9_9BACT|nr:hypothetical protein [Niabella pedocola]MCD2426152.1 hypothetical protein [Niabella pedocola]
MNRLTLMLLFCTAIQAAFGQRILKDTLPPSLELELHLIDLPFMTDAAKTETIRRQDGSAVFPGRFNGKGYGAFYRNPGMTQATDMAHNLHGSLYYAHNALWKRLKKPRTTAGYVLNRLLANATALGTDYLAIKLPYGYAFQHEEFHRAVMTARHVYSYDAVWDFGKGLDIAVTRVKDADLVYLKKRFPADQVRLAAAGVEGEYAYFRRMQQDNFFRKSGYPFVGLSLLGTFHAINYVKLPLSGRFNRITDSILAQDKNDILARDFTGYDFSAWVYDLFTPEEPYETRGSWPDGVGIRRPVSASQLSPGMKHFLKETGRMQYLNLVSPFMIGINRIQLRPGVLFNFALRSVPTSFGYYAGGDFFLDLYNRQFLVSLGVNRNDALTLPALEMRAYGLQKRASKRFHTDVHLAAWLQPKDQLFFSRQSVLGMGLSVQPYYALTRRFGLMGSLSYKTRGWMFENPYLDQKFTGNLGFRWKVW